MAFEIDEGFGHWLAGFADGEGCFIIADQSRNPTGAGSFSCWFRICLHGDDAPILREVAARLGIGSVWTGTSASQAGTRAMWTVRKKDECLALVGIFERFPLRAKKAHDFAVWSEAVREWSTKRAGIKGQDWAAMAALRVQLSQGRTPRGRLPDLSGARYAV